MKDSVDRRLEGMTRWNPSPRGVGVPPMPAHSATDSFQPPEMAAVPGLSILRLARRGGCGEVNAMSETIHYRPGKEPHPRENRLVFKNIDREGWTRRSSATCATAATRC